MTEGLGDFFKLIAENKQEIAEQKQLIAEEQKQEEEKLLEKKRKEEESIKSHIDMGLSDIFEQLGVQPKKERENKETIEIINEEKDKKEEFDKLISSVISVMEPGGAVETVQEEVEEVEEEEVISEQPGPSKQEKVLTFLESFLTKKIDDIEEIKEEVQGSPIVEPDETRYEEWIDDEFEESQHQSLIEKSLGMLSELSENIPGAEENFATLDDLQSHYKSFLVKIQQQLSTLGGGGENNNDGWEYVSDKALESTPIALGTDTWTQVTNDGTSSSTKRQWLPKDSSITRVYDVVNNKIKLNELPTDGHVIFRLGVKFIPNVDNTTVKVRIAWTTESDFTFYLESTGTLLNDGAGIEYEKQFILPFYVGDLDSKNGSGIIEARADGACSITDSAFFTIIG